MRVAVTEKGVGDVPVSLSCPLQVPVFRQVQKHFKCPQVHIICSHSPESVIGLKRRCLTAAQEALMDDSTWDTEARPAVRAWMASLWQEAQKWGRY